MPVLVFDTSGRDAAIALGIGDDCVLRDVPRQAGRHARLLIPTAANLLAEHDIEPSALTGLGVNLGPGSFTGLRVGVAAMQTLAWANDVPAVGVTQFDIAAQIGQDRERWIVLNAEREELFIAKVAAGSTGAGEFEIVADETFLGRLREHFAAVVGPLPRRVADAVAKVATILEPAEPPAATLLRLVRAKLAAGEATPPAQLLPLYGRRSAAEELRDAGRRPNYASNRNL